MTSEEPPGTTRKRRRLRRQLSQMLIATALVSLLMVGVVNFVAARVLLEDGSREQLVEVAESRVNSIESGVDRLLDSTSITARGPSLVSALSDFERAFAELADDPPETGDDTMLDEFYEERVIAPLAELDIDVTADEVVPTGAGRYLQERYTIPAATGSSSPTDDDTAYSQAIERHDDQLVGLIDETVFSDVLLISAEGDVVYTANKSLDLGTDLIDGPLSDSVLARTWREELPRVRSGDAVLADFALYLPSGGQPTAFAIAALEDGAEVIGAVALGVPVEQLNEITTAGGDWESVGLRDGETYVVGPDLTLQSESRLWIEDPERYLSEVGDPELASRIELLGSPIVLQTVDTEPVRTAIDGDTFSGSATNYLGEKTFAYARQILVGGVRWVVVAEQPISALRGPLYEYASRLGLVVLIVLPLAAAIGFLIADRLTRSIPPVVAMAEAIAGGERDLTPPDLGRNEFGDLARQLERMAGELGRQEAALEAEFEERRQLLLSVLPARLVGGEGEVEGTGESIYLGTVIAVAVEPTGDPAADEAVAELLSRFGALAEAHANDFEVERVRTAADRFLFVCGIDRDDDGAEQAARFAADLVDIARELADDPDDRPLEVRIGMATGAVATGVLDSGSLTFTVWGNPVRRALAIVSLAAPGETLVDSSTVDALADGWRMEPAPNVIALDGAPMSLFAFADQSGAGAASGAGDRSDSDQPPYSDETSESDGALEV